MNKLVSKLTSRKFWIAVAAFLASIGAGITGFVTDNTVLATVGTICTIVSAAIYAAAEAYVDGASIKANPVTISASTNSAATVEKLITKDETNLTAK